MNCYKLLRIFHNLFNTKHPSLHYLCDKDCQLWNSGSKGCSVILKHFARLLPQKVVTICVPTSNILRHLLPCIGSRLCPSNLNRPPHPMLGAGAGLMVPIIVRGPDACHQSCATLSVSTSLPAPWLIHRNCSQCSFPQKQKRSVLIVLMYVNKSCD